MNQPTLIDANPPAIALYAPGRLPIDGQTIIVVSAELTPRAGVVGRFNAETGIVEAANDCMPLAVAGGWLPVAAFNLPIPF